MKTKFRAWDKYLKKMFNNVNPIFDADGNLDFIIYEYGNTGHDMIEIDLKKWDSAMLYHYDEGIPVELMQYTGLSDSEGVEIYEGDIVRVTHDEYFIDEVCTVVWGLDNNDTYPAFHMPELDTESNSFSEVFNVDGYFVKVIGNIYQNKDLLEGE